MDSSAEHSIEEHDVEPVIRAGAAHRSDDVMLWVHIGDVIAEGFSVDPARDPADKHPTIVLKRMTAQQLFDDLWAMGFRPEPTVYGNPIISFEIATDGATELDSVDKTPSERIAAFLRRGIPHPILNPPLQTNSVVAQSDIQVAKPVKLCEPITLVEAIRGEVNSDVDPGGESESQI